MGTSTFLDLIRRFAESSSTSRTNPVPKNIRFNTDPIWPYFILNRIPLFSNWGTKCFQIIKTRKCVTPFTVLTSLTIMTRLNFSHIGMPTRIIPQDFFMSPRRNAIGRFRVIFRILFGKFVIQCNQIIDSRNYKAVRTYWTAVLFTTIYYRHPAVPFFTPPNSVTLISFRICRKRLTTI